MDDHESLLGAEPYRFDDWVDEAYCVSRLTIVGADGVPRTYEARAGDHAAARQQACMLAASERRAAPWLLMSPPMAWSNATVSAPQGIDGGLGGGMPLLLRDTAAPTTVTPVAIPCSTPMGVSLLLPHHPAGSYPFQHFGPPAGLSPSANVVRSDAQLTQAQQPQQPASASVIGVENVGLDDTGAGPTQPLFRIDRTPSRVNDSFSSREEDTPNREDGLRSEDLGIVSSAGKSTNRKRSSVHTEDPGVQGTPRSGTTLGVGIETGMTSPKSDQKRGFHDSDHVGMQRNGIPSQPEMLLWMDPSSPWHVQTDPGVANCASNKRRKTGAFKLVSAARPEVAVHSSPEKTNKDAIEAEDDSDREDDYVTTYNELCQRGVANLSVPEYKYVDLSSGNMSSKWECCATIAATPPLGGSPITITKTVSGRNKRDSRRVAAKAFLSELLERNIISRATVATKGIYVNSTARSSTRAALSPDFESEITAKQVAEAAEAVSILNQLWQKEKFDGKPKWTLTPASSGATGQWTCTIFIRTKHFGDVSVESTQSQKKYARHFAAYNAVQKLRELGCPDVNSINVQPKQQSNVVQSISDDCEVGSKSALQSLKALDDATRSKLDSAGHASGEVAGFWKDAGVDTSFGALFRVPSTVKTLIARNVGDVNEWIAENVADGTALGLCLDSKDLRKALEAEAKECHVDVASAAFTSDECRAIALSTEKSAILVAASLVESCGRGEWVPKSMKFMLERNECAKYGFGLEEGTIVLRYSHGIHCANLNSLSSSSHALTEDWHAKQENALTAAGLVSDWLSKKLSPFANICVQSVTGLAEAVKASEHVIAPVLTLAVASHMVRSCQRQEVERRRRKLVGCDDHIELSNRLWSPLSRAKPEFKLRRRLTR